MKIWYQTYAALGVEPKWKTYEEELKKYAQKVARPDTEIAIHGVDKYASRMNDSDYIQFMHIPQVIDKALQAEREGYDVICTGGALDLAHIYYRELLDIPVAFIWESSLYNACLLARQFGIVGVNEGLLQRQMGLVKYHGLEQRCVSGVHVGVTGLEVADLIGKDPQRAIDMFTEGARKVIAQGAGVIVPGFGAWSSFLGQQDIHDIDGIPLVDGIAVVIKTAEMLVDLHKMGVKRSRRGLYTAYPPKEELLAARKIYGVE